MLAHFDEARTQFFISGGLFREMAEPDQKSDDSLSKIVVEFLTNTLPFRFLCVYQSLMKTQEFFFAFLAVLNVYAAPNVAEKLTLWATPGNAGVHDPVIGAVMAAEPILQSERFLVLKRGKVFGDCGFTILWMQESPPAITELAFCRSSGELQPGLVEVDEKPIRVRHPDHYRRGVYKRTKATFAFAQGRIRHALLLSEYRQE